MGKSNQLHQESWTDVDELNFQEQEARMLKTPKAGGDFKKAPPGMHLAICCRIIDLGTQKIEWSGEVKYQHKILIQHELPNTLVEIDGESLPFFIGNRYTFSHHEKAALRKDLESWYGKKFNTQDLDNAGGFEINKILGKPSMINVVHSEDGQYANIASINPVPKGTEIPGLVADSYIYEMNGGGFDKLSDKLQEIVKKSKEWRGVSTETSERNPPDEWDDDIPF